MFEQQRVFLPRADPGLQEYVAELTGFPKTKFADQVDSTSQALLWLTRKTAQRRPIVRRDPQRRDVVRASITGVRGS